MDEPYTPTKTLDEPYTPTKIMEQFDDSSLLDSPAVYIPTRIGASTSESPVTNKPEETNRQKYGSQGDAYTPTKPGIRIVKRKPTSKTNETPVTSTLGKRSAPEDSDDVAIQALKQAPKKGILRLYTPGPKRPNRSIFFADTKGFPLTAIKEIEKIASIHHSNYEDFRTFERNEARVDRGDQLEEVDWLLMPVKGRRPISDVKTVSAQREEERLLAENVIRGSIFGILEDNPELTNIAGSDLEKYAPLRIPTDSGSEKRASMAAFRDLPMPGRSQQPDNYNYYQAAPAQNQYEQVLTGETSNIYQATMAPSSSSSSSSQPDIQQVFAESQPAPVQYYTSEEPKSKTELPEKLKQMLNQLKMKGFVSSEDSDTTPTPVSTAPLAAAMQTAQQILQSQQTTVTNTYAQETTEAPREFVNGYDGYIAEFVTPEMLDQERRQDSQHNEGWTQSGWKIQENCTYFLNRRDGCNRGEHCRFIHDEDLRRKQQSSMRPRAGYNRDQDDRGFRGRRGNFRGGFRNANHHDRDFRHDRHNRFDNKQQHHGGRAGFEQPQAEVASYSPEAEYTGAGAVPPVDNSIDMTAYMQQQQYIASQNQEKEKKKRVSRFDQRDNEPTEYRPQRRNRFDEGPSAQPTRQFRSRFDERPKEHEEHNYFGQF